MKPNNPCPKIHASVQFIDPSWAAKLLSTNPEHQRTISRSNLTKIENSIREEKFFLNGQAVIVSDSGKLLDGQHRLQAVVNANIGIWTVLVTNIPDEYFTFMDNGKSRSFSDVLKTMGKVNTASLGSTIQRLAEYLDDPISIGIGKVFSHAQLMATEQLCPDVGESVRAVLTCREAFSTTRCAWMHYVLMQHCPEVCEQFFESLGSGEMLGRTDPIFVLRNRTLNDRALGRHGNTREMIAILIKTWNAHWAGKPMKIARWTEAESFPLLTFPPKGQVRKSA